MSLARRLPGALGQPGAGGEVLDPGKALYAVDLVEDHKSQDGANAEDGLEKMERPRIVSCRHSVDVPLEVGDDTVVVPDELEVDGCERDLLQYVQNEGVREDEEDDPASPAFRIHRGSMGRRH